MSIKEDIINGIIEREGGYVNDASDSGGETMYGITKSVAYAYGYSGDMKNLPRDTAFKMYSSMYWDKMRLDDIEALSSRIAEEVADTGVNMGTKRAGIFLQRSLNVLNNRETHYKDLVVDGVVGEKTIVALKSFLRVRGGDGEKVILRAIMSLKGAFYIELAERREKDEKFVFGWLLNRVA